MPTYRIDGLACATSAYDSPNRAIAWGRTL
ncbi:Uncharacterised protein [Bordetella pertussis]|nr:Uncharacterised protein [Bordetella pertussis]